MIREHEITSPHPVQLRSLEIVLGELVSNVSNMSVKIEEMRRSIHNLKNDGDELKTRLIREDAFREERQRRAIELEKEREKKISGYHRRVSMYQWLAGIAIAILSADGIIQIIKHLIAS